MAKYILRLDDACPNMNITGWWRMEKLLDQYGIKPLVGIIPENNDPAFQWEFDPYFWTDTVVRWKEKKWSLAQHGCHHKINEAQEGVWSEFVGKSLEEQKRLLHKGYAALLEKDIIPCCFFAPCHTYDSNTYSALKEQNRFAYVSDGYALSLYQEDGLVFLPNMFDTPHKLLPFGTYTFVFHPNNTTNAQFEQLEQFLAKNSKKFISADEFVASVSKKRNRFFFEKMIEPTINFIRKIR